MRFLLMAHSLLKFRSYLRSYLYKFLIVKVYQDKTKQDFLASCLTRLSPLEDKPR